MAFVQAKQPVADWDGDISFEKAANDHIPF
jgi:hypothetical protein